MADDKEKKDWNITIRGFGDPGEAAALARGFTDKLKEVEGQEVRIAHFSPGEEMLHLPPVVPEEEPAK